MSTPITSSPVWPNYSKTNVAKASTKSTALGKDQFLSLFVAQLKNQDPLSPMDNTQFVAQMAQFSSVEQLLNIADEISLLRQNIGTASSLIGKYVSWQEYDSNGQVVTGTGIVESIVTNDNKLYVEVNGKLVGIDFINQISVNQASESSDSFESDSTQLASNDTQEGNEVSGS